MELIGELSYKIPQIRADIILVFPENIRLIILEIMTTKVRHRNMCN